MQENDARRLDHHTLEALRERAVRKVQEGESPEVVARVLGLNRSTVYGWLAQYRRGCFFLPPYSPDRNPDELVWKHLKADTVGRRAIQSYADFKGKVKSSMLSLQRNTKKIRSFFAKETLRYALNV